MSKDGKVEILKFKKIFGNSFDKKSQISKDKKILQLMTKKTGERIKKDFVKKKLLFVDFSYFTNGGKRDGITKLYKSLLERQKTQVGKLIENDFIDEETVEYNPASTIGGPTTIGNGFEIYWMDPGKSLKK